MNLRHAKWLIVAGLAICVLFLLNLMSMTPARVVAGNLRQAATDTPTPTPTACPLCSYSTYHTINFDGAIVHGNEWSDVSEKLGRSSAITYYVTWDDTFLYVGMVGGNTDNDRYNLLIDIDPDNTGAANSGTQSQYCGATFGADGKPDYAISKYPGGVTREKAFGYWTNLSPETTALNGANQVEFRVRWSDVELPSRTSPVGLYLFACTSSGQVWSAWPPSNLQWTGYYVQELTTRTYFPTTDNGRIPRTYAQQRGDQTAFNASGSVSLLNGFARLSITAGGGAGCDVTVRVRGNAAVTTFNNSVRRLYDITPTNCSSLTANITLKYLDGTEYEAVDELNGATEGSLNLYHWNGMTWDTIVPDARDTAANTVTKNGVTSFSPWAFGGSDSPTAIALTHLEIQNRPAAPITLLLLSSMILVGAGVAIWKRRRI